MSPLQGRWVCAVPTVNQHEWVVTWASPTLSSSPPPRLFLTLSLPLWATQPGSRAAEELTQDGRDVGR